MIATNTTRILVTNTARLRAAVRAIDPFTAGAVGALLAVLVIGLLLPRAAATPAPAPVLQPALSRADGRPRLAHPIARRAAPAAARPLPTVAPQPTPVELAPVAAPVAPAQQLQVDTAPAQPTAATGWTADPQIQSSGSGSISTFEPPADAPRLCTGFGDWRDYDANYASSPICHQEAP